MIEGWIKLHRKLLDWERYSDPNVMLTFIHILLNANHEEKKRKGVTILPGQMISGSIETPKKIGISRSQYRLSVNKLKTTNNITTKTTNKYTVITVIGWDIYQSDNKNKPTKQPTTGQTDDHQTTTPKEVSINILTKKEKNNISEFDKFYEIYPKHEARGKAEDGYKKALSITTHENIMEGVKNYIHHIKRSAIEKKYIKLPATWLNQQCRLDDYVMKSNTTVSVDPPSKAEIEFMKEIGI